MLHTQIVSVVGEGLVVNAELSNILSKVFSRLGELGIHLRTSGSLGIENIAMEEYKKLIDNGSIAPSRINIFIPWRGYNTMFYKYPSDIYTTLSCSNYKSCSSFVRVVHNHYNTLSDKNKKLYARIPLILFGRKLNRPSDFLIISCPKDVHGNYIGATAVAVKLAEIKGIPVFNFHTSVDVEETLIELRKYLRSKGLPVITEREVAYA